MTEIKVQKNLGAGLNSAKNKRENLHEILEQLLIKGKFDRCVLCDDNGMIFSDVGQSEFRESAVGGMFALIHNVLKRTIENLDLISLDIIKIRTVKGIFLSSIFKIDHYNRSMILTVYFNDETEFETKTDNYNKNITDITKKRLKPRITLFNLLKLYLKSKLQKEDNFTLISKTLFNHNSPKDIFNHPKSIRDQKKSQTERNNSVDEKTREILIKNSVDLLKKIFEN